MPARKYTDEQIARAAELREAGVSTTRIAEVVGMSRGAVAWHCLRVGADLPADQRKTNPEGAPCIMQRSGHTVRRFTEEEDATILRMEADGASITEIGRAIGRKHNSVIGRMMTLARQDARAEEGAA